MTRDRKGLDDCAFAVRWPHGRILSGFRFIYFFCRGLCHVLTQ
jgi:hypothetical protein